jgi:hypothetical protein
LITENTEGAENGGNQGNDRRRNGNQPQMNADERGGSNDRKRKGLRGRRRD